MTFRFARPACRSWLAVLALALAPAVPAPLRAQGAAPDTAAPANLMDAFARASRAIGAGDHLAVRRTLEAALAFAPTNPHVLWHLARAQAMTGDATAALATLERLAAQGVARDVAVDTAFATIRTGPAAPRFRAVAAQLEAAAAPIVRSDSAFAIPDPDFIPEGIAYDAAQDAFFVGSLRYGGVLRIGRDGVARPFLPGSRTDLAEVLGLRVDVARQRLWLAAFVSDGAAPRHRDGGGGWAELRAYDLRTGALAGRWPAPDSTRPQLLNDIAIAPNGDAYVTDSEGGALFRLRSGARALARVHGGEARGAQFTYPNGLAIASDGRMLYVAHMEGLTAFPLLDSLVGQPLRVTMPAGISGGGIDGLYACGTSLLAVQSLLDFQQVTRFVLERGGRAVTRVEALERRHPRHQAATTGAITDEALYYIANAQLGRLRPRGATAPASTPASSVVLRLPIAGGCGGGVRPARTSSIR